MNKMESGGYWTRSKNKLNITTNFGHLNEHVYDNILIFLSVKDLKNMKLLSKQYNTWTRETLIKRSVVKIACMTKFLSIMESDFSPANIHFEDIKLSDLSNNRKFVKKFLRWMDKHGCAIKSLTFEEVIWGTLINVSNRHVDTQYVVKHQEYELLTTILAKLTSLKSISIDGMLHLHGNYSSIDTFDIPRLPQITSVKSFRLDMYTNDLLMRTYAADCKEGIVVQKLVHGIATTFPHIQSWKFEFIVCRAEAYWTPSCTSSWVIVIQQMLSLMVSSPEMFPALDSLTFFTLSRGCCIIQSLEKMKRFSPALIGQLKELNITMGWTRNHWNRHANIIKVLEEVLKYCRANLQKFTVKLVNENDGSDFPPPIFTLNVPPMPSIKMFRIMYMIYYKEHFNVMISDIPRNTVITLNLDGEGGFDIV